MEQKTAQLRALPNVISQYGSGVFWETPSRAKFLIDTGQFVLVNAPGPVEQPAVGPSETKPAGPSEIKEATEKKSSVDAPAGPSTASASLSEPGAAAQSSVSEEDRALPESNAPTSKRRGRQPKLES